MSAWRVGFEWAVALLGVVGHFDGTNASVIFDRYKAQNDLSVRVGLDSPEGLRHWSVGSPGTAIDVEIAQQRHTV